MTKVLVAQEGMGTSKNWRIESNQPLHDVLQLQQSPLPQPQPNPFQEGKFRDFVVQSDSVSFRKGGNK